MKIVDLTLGLHNGMITYPTSSHQIFESSIMGRIEIEGRETRKFTMGSHCGTHIDAPKHFIKNGTSIDQFDVNDLVGEALLVDLGDRNPKSIITSNDIKNCISDLKKYNLKRVVFKTNWSNHWNTNQYYNDWPYFSDNAMNLLLECDLKLIGLDFPSPDSAYFGNDCSMDSPNHKKIFNKGIILTEYLTNLDKLNTGKIFLIVSPLKLIDFDGAPSRVLAHNL
jgi:kynurenine formamidase